MGNSIFFNKDAREKIKSGIDISVDAIKTTLGGCGKTAIICEGGLVSITKDGVTVARSINLNDPIQNIGATIIKNVTEKTLEDAGDATTATAVLTQKILEYGFDFIEKGVNQLELKKGIDLAVDNVSKQLSEMAQKVGDDNEKIKNIATISSNNDKEIGELIADAFSQIGNDGELLIEDSKTFKTYIRIDEGFKIDRGYISPYFSNPETMIATLTEPYILFYEGKIDKFAQVKPLLESMMAEKKRDILIICDNVEGEAIQTLVMNKIKGVVNVVCVSAPYFGERRKYAMEDMAAITGGTYISNEKGIDAFELSHCGSCGKVVVTKDNTTIVEGRGDKEVLTKITSQIDSLISNSESDVETDMLKLRRSKVNGKLAVICVGAPTEIEMKEKKDRVDDAIRATKCAIEEGIVPGGGVALLNCIKLLSAVKTENDWQKNGVYIIQNCLLAPIRQILENAGIEDGHYESEKYKVWWGRKRYKKSIGRTKISVISDVLSLGGKYGYNVKTGEIENFFTSGIIDAAKVVRVSLVNAASVAGTIITSETLLV